MDYLNIYLPALLVTILITIGAGIITIIPIYGRTDYHQEHNFDIYNLLLRFN